MPLSITEHPPAPTRARASVFPALLVAAFLVVAVPLVAIGFRAPAHVERLVVVNETARDVSVHAVDADGDVLPLGQAQAGTTEVLRDVLDAGREWRLVWSSGGTTVETTTSRADLAADDWTVTVPG